MKEPAQKKLVLVCAVPVLVALFLSATVAPTLRNPPEPRIDAGKALMERLRKDRQLAQIVPASARSQDRLIALANEHPLLLDGLVKTVIAANEHSQVRMRAFYAIMQIDRDEALVESINAIQEWFLGDQPKGRRTGWLRANIGNWTIFTVLGAQIPDEECLAIVKRARPDAWKGILTSHADRSEPPSVVVDAPRGFRERVERIPLRARQLLEMVQ